MSRALINDKALAEDISRNFIPFAASVERLQPSRYGGSESDSSIWFQKHAKAAFAKYAPKGWWEQFQTYQGFYVLGPDGSCHSYKVAWKISPGQLRAELSQALGRYKKSPPNSVSVPPPTTSSSPIRPPKGVSVLRVFSRIRPLPSGAPASNRGIGRDHMWITSQEVKSCLKSGKLPPTVISRLIRYQLLDHVRNVSPGFEGTDVKTAHFQSSLVGKDTLEFSGRFDSKGRTNNGKPFGMKGTIKGRLTLDSATNRVTRCRAFSKATAFGESTPEAPKGTYPMQFAIVEVNDMAARRVPPTYYGLSPLFRKDYLNSVLP